MIYIVAFASLVIMLLSLGFVFGTAGDDVPVWIVLPLIGVGAAAFIACFIAFTVIAEGVA